MSDIATFNIKRIYEKPSASDGFRLLVDRLWPRGVRKEDAAIALWAKDLAPSPQLRKWFNHDPQRFDTFRDRYLAELRENETVLQSVRLPNSGTVTLLYAARDEVHNHAIVLQRFLSYSFGKGAT